MGEGAMVQTPTPPSKTDKKLWEANRTDTKEVGRRIWDDRLRGWGNLPGGRPSATTGEGVASHLAPTEEGETSVGAAICHPQDKVGPDIWRPQEKVGPAIGAHRP